MTAALQVLAESGMAGMTLSRLAEVMGGSRMTLNRKGVTRERVIEVLSVRAAGEYQRGVWPAMTSPGPGAERLEQALRATCDVADRWRHLLVGLFAEDGGVFHEPNRAEDAAGREVAVATRSVFVEPLVRLLRDGAQDGSLRATDDPARDATVLFNQIGWTFLSLRVGQRWAATEASTAVVNMALRALLADPPETDGQAERIAGR